MTGSKTTTKPCSVEGCAGKRYCRGWCIKHYGRWRKHGDPSVSLTLQGEPVIVRLARFTASGSAEECWPWLGAVNWKGYGHSFRDGKQMQAHRVMYEETIGPIREGMTLDHVCHTKDRSCPGGNICRHRSCVNPFHMDQVSAAVNTSRGLRAAQTHCKRGHEFTAENTGIGHQAGGTHRFCRECRRTERQRQRQRQAEA